MFKRDLIFTESFLNFYLSLDADAQKKIDHSLRIIEQENRPPTTFFKHITDGDGFFEVIAKSKGRQYRVLSYFENGEWLGALILLGGFQKKNNKKGYIKPHLKQAKKEQQSYEELQTPTTIKDNEDPPNGTDVEDKSET